MWWWGKRTRPRGQAGGRRKGSPPAPVSVGRRREPRGRGRGGALGDTSEAGAERCGQTSGAQQVTGTRSPTPSIPGASGGAGAAARRPVPAFPVPSGAVFGGRNGSCCGKRPPVWCRCSSAEPELWEPLPPERAPPPLSAATSPLRRAATPRPRPRPAPGARSKLSDMLRSGRLKRSWERAGAGEGWGPGEPGAAWSRLAAGRALHFQFYPHTQRHDGRGPARLRAPPGGLVTPVAIVTRCGAAAGVGGGGRVPAPGRVSAKAATSGKASSAVTG